MMDFKEYEDITDFPAQHYLQINNCGCRKEVNQDFTIFRPRGRKDHYLLYLQSGSVQVEHGRESAILNEGQCLYYPPSVRQLYSFSSANPPVAYYVHFTGGAVAESLALLKPSEDKIYKIRNRAIFENLFRRLCSLYNSHRIFGEPKQPMFFLEINGVLLELLDVLVRSSRPSEKQRPGEIMVACSYFLEHYQEDIDLAKCAADVHMSLSRFSHLFTENMGISPYRFVLVLRIDSAKELLLYSNMSIREIAESTGFSDATYFSRLFRKYVGVSPQKYRKMHVAPFANPPVNDDPRPIE